MCNTLSVDIREIYKNGFKIPTGYNAEFKLCRAGDVVLDYETGTQIRNTVPYPEFHGKPIIVLTKLKHKVVTFKEFRVGFADVGEFISDGSGGFLRAKVDRYQSRGYAAEMIYTRVETEE